MSCRRCGIKRKEDRTKRGTRRSIERNENDMQIIKMVLELLPLILAGPADGGMAKDSGGGDLQDDRSLEKAAALAGHSACGRWCAAGELSPTVSTAGDPLSFSCELTL